MVVEQPFQNVDVYDTVEDLSQVEVIPPHEMLTEFKNINVAGKLNIPINIFTCRQSTRLVASQQLKALAGCCA